MKRNRLFAPIGILLFLLLCIVPNSQGQASPSSLPYLSPGAPYQLGIGFSFTSTSTQTNAFNVGGLQYYTIAWTPSGTVSGCTLTVDGAPITGGSFSTGSIVSSQTCTSAGSFTTSSATQAYQAKVTPTVTGTGTVSVFVFGYVSNPAGLAGSVSQSGTWTDRVVGSAGAAFDAAANAVAPANSVIIGGVFNTSVQAPTAGNVEPLQLDSQSNLVVSARPISNNGLASVSAAVENGITTSVNVKASAGSLYGLSFTNAAASVCYVEFQNSAGAGTLGTGTLVAIPLSPTGTTPTTIILPYPVQFATGIAVGAATAAGGSTACGSAVSGTVFYK